MKVVYAILILLLSSCSANWHLKQAIAKNPSIIEPRIIKVIDTLYVIDSFVQYDTFVANELDTIVLDGKKSEIVIYKYKNRFIVKTKIKSDTIRIVKTIELPPQIKYVEKKSMLNVYMSYVSLIFALLTILYLYAKKVGNAK